MYILMLYHPSENNLQKLKYSLKYTEYVHIYKFVTNK